MANLSAPAAPSHNMTARKFTWCDGSNAISLYRTDNRDSIREDYKVTLDDKGEIVRVTRISSGHDPYVNGGYRYKRISSKSGLQHIRALLDCAEELNPRAATAKTRGEV